MRTIDLPFDPEGAYFFYEDGETWLPMLCPACNQGWLAEEYRKDIACWVYTCWHPVHPMYSCHMQWVVYPNTAFGSWQDSIDKLTSLGVLPLR